MAAKYLRKRGVKTVQPGNKLTLGSERVGNGYPREVGIEPKVVRGDSLTPILPRGMSSGKIVDESAGGDPYKF